MPVQKYFGEGIRRLKVKCRIIPSPDYFHFYYRNNEIPDTNLPSEALLIIKMKTCSNSCLKCENTGIFKVNFSGLHKLCKDHVSTQDPLIFCNKCCSEVVIIYDFLHCPTCPAEYASSLCICNKITSVSCQKTCIKCCKIFCRNCVSPNGVCEACLNYQKNGGNLKLISSSQKNNFLRPKDCLEGPLSSLSSSSMTDRNNTAIINKYQLSPGNKTNHLKEESKSKICSVCAHRKSNIKKKKGNWICFECELGFIEGSKDICKNCGEKPENSDLLCSHRGCETCKSKYKVCFNCIKKGNEEFLMKHQIDTEGSCVFCNSTGLMLTLFCNHLCCLKCLISKKVYNLNYVCKVCLLIQDKNCINCGKVCVWIECKNSKYLNKMCCDSVTICRICLKKNSYFNKCNCKHS